MDEDNKRTSSAEKIFCPNTETREARLWFIDRFMTRGFLTVQWHRLIWMKFCMIDRQYDSNHTRQCQSRVLKKDDCYLVYMFETITHPFRVIMAGANSGARIKDFDKGALLAHVNI